MPIHWEKTLYKVEYVGGPWCGVVALLNLVGEDFAFENTATHCYRYDGNMRSGNVRYRWTLR